MSGIALIPVVVALQATVPTSNTPVEQTEESLGSVALSATRIDVSTSSVGYGYHLIEQQEIERMQTPHLVDVLRAIPGLQVRRSGGVGGQTSFFLRGTNSNHTHVMLNGVGLGDPTGPSGAPLLDNALALGIARVEVLYGPQSGRWGSDAIGGVIQLETSIPDIGTHGFYTFEAGSYETFRHSIGGSYATENSWIAVALNRFDSAGISAREGAEGGNGEQDPYRNTSGMAQMGWEGNGGLALTGGFWFNAADIEFDDQFSATKTQDELQSQEMTAWVQAAVELNSDLRSEVNISLRDINRNSFTPGFQLHTDGWRSEASWLTTLDIGQSSIQVGTDWSHDDVDSVNNFASAQQFHEDNLGIFVQGDIAIMDALSAHVALRQDVFSQHENAITWSAALAYDMSENTQFFANIGKGYRVPTAAEWSTNTSLKPEESIGWEIGMRQVLLPSKWDMSAHYFQHEIDQLIAYDFSAFQLENITAGRSRGVDVATTVYLQEGTEISASYTYTDTYSSQSPTLPQGARLLRRPLHQVSLQFNYTLVDDLFSMHASVYYNSDSDDINSAENASYWLANFGASYQLNSHVKLFMRIENVFDESYQEVNTFQAAGASIYGGFTCHY